MDGQECRSRAWNTAYAIWLMASALPSIIDTWRCQGSRSWPLLRQRHSPPAIAALPLSSQKIHPFPHRAHPRSRGKERKKVQFSIVSLWKLISLIHVVVICKEIRLHCDSNRGEFKIVLEYFLMVTGDDLRDLSQEKVNSYRSIGECGGVKEGKSVNFCYYTFPMM